MFQQVGGDHHLFLDGIVDFDVIEGILNAVGLHGKADFGLQGDVDQEAVADHLFFFKAAVIGVKDHLFQIDGGDILTGFHLSCCLIDGAKIMHLFYTGNSVTRGYNKSRLKPAFVCLKAVLLKAVDALFNDGHLINQVSGTGEFVDDEKDVADVYIDALLQLGFKGDVATHGFPVAVEGQTN